MHITSNAYHFTPTTFIMNSEQKNYIDGVNSTEDGIILIKDTGREGISLPSHHHRQTQAVMTLQGTLHVLAVGREYFVPEGNVCWIPSEVEHSLSSNNRQIAVRIFYLPISFAKNSPGSMFGIYTLNSWLSANLHFMASHGSSIEKQYNATLYRYCISFFRLFPDVGQKYLLPLKGISTGFEPKLSEALQFIDLHLSENLRLDDVAKGTGMSSRSLSRLFKENGISFSSYMNNHRIVRALELMADRKMTLREIAFAVGFSAPANFNRSFKQVMGMSPTEMKKEGR